VRLHFHSLIWNPHIHLQTNHNHPKHSHTRHLQPTNHSHGHGTDQNNTPYTNSDPTQTNAKPEPSNCCKRLQPNHPRPAHTRLSHIHTTVLSVSIRHGHVGDRHNYEHILSGPLHRDCHGSDFSDTRQLRPRRSLVQRANRSLHSQPHTTPHHNIN